MNWNAIMNSKGDLGGFSTLIFQESYRKSVVKNPPASCVGQLL
jgi:hypothetical protein